MKKKDAPSHKRQEEGGLLITGCPRSATRSVTAYFKSHNVFLGHETAGEMGTVEWRHAYTPEPDFLLRLTLVRDPMKTIASLTEMLTNCDRKSITWSDIIDLAILGGWTGKLKNGKFFEAATDWWTTVYERLYEYPLIKVEHIPKLPESNRHRRVDRDFDTRDALKDEADFWRVAKMYGYYTGQPGDV